VTSPSAGTRVPLRDGGRHIWRKVSISVVNAAGGDAVGVPRRNVVLGGEGLASRGAAAHGNEGGGLGSKREKKMTERTH
jgi:hypothetical protein